ncbi:MAG: hypothetical protein KF687_15690 [Cyclobacteriaceae bacterium]|nr:hypothetical protein [Cyclobacteriaceae bacterium]
MLGLGIIKVSKKNMYLGLSGLVFFEIPDDHKVIDSLLPQGIKFKRAKSLSYLGRGLRLVLTTNSRSTLAIIKGSRSVNGIKGGRLICYINNSGLPDKMLLEDLRSLASKRWPSGQLSISITELQKHPGNLENTLLLNGWLRADGELIQKV